ncbi:preprotein translocase subunit SecE [Ructibacterium gallinarum]|uniref:Protein translocase subunit SecE n=1 Tax=Ructibacterium gallinarum TaxID=2779355 RepID=A0A9D5M3G0_9FIRM|nr:preprotein translocase subunit SecE [Ructibacterium gallinarum]MBE5039905.1 preprotein translocase subunit SecE [Ructibacterium gallinarum]
MEHTKPNFFVRIVNYFKEVKSEMKKVVWPAFSKVRQNTIIVIIYVLIVGVVIWALDMLFTWGMSFFINR